LESNELYIEDWTKSLETENPLVQLKKYKDAVYIGELKDLDGRLVRSGKGLMLYASGRRYEGYWLDDVRHGRGYEKHSSGNIYIGVFVQGKAHGHGLYKWINGE
jgi:hypothetical protein